jgi:hypothetical protein
MQAQSGAELACRAHNYRLPPGASQLRGILSYYAAAALPAAQTMGDWLTRIEAQVQADVDRGDLPVFYRPQLQLLGDTGHQLPGGKADPIEPL